MKDLPFCIDPKHAEGECAFAQDRRKRIADISSGVIFSHPADGEATKLSLVVMIHLGTLPASLEMMIHLGILPAPDKYP